MLSKLRVTIRSLFHTALIPSFMCMYPYHFVSCGAVVGRMQANREAKRERANDERFPGDAGTMKEKNREEVLYVGLTFGGCVEC